MFQEFEGSTKDFSEFNYETTCSGNYDILNFSSFHIQDVSFPISDGNRIVPTEVHLRDFKSEGDSPSVSQEIEAFTPCIQQDNLSYFNECFSNRVASDEYAVDDPFWIAPAPSNVIPPPSYQLNELKIRYTKQYLLNCRRSPLSRSFPDCLQKYVAKNDLPLKQKTQEVHGDYRNMDHILFYNNLPFSRKKYSLGNAFMKNLSM